MKRKEFMLLVLSMGMIMMLSGCGANKTNEVIDTTVATEVEMTTENGVSENRYSYVDVQIPYSAMVKEDIHLILDMETNEQSESTLIKETYVTVVAEVYCDGVLQDYYKVDLEDGSKGFIEGRYLEFNVDVVEDYADTLVEVEGGDGEEETTEVIKAEVESTEEVVEEEAPSLGYVVTDCNPVTKYTNTSANIRSIPDKSGELVNTVSLNTEFQVTGTTDNGWSRIESNGVVCFIKSSLLSDTKTEVKQPSQSQSSSQPQASQPQASEPAPAPSQPDTSGLPADFFDDAGPSFGDIPVGGTTGQTPSGDYSNAVFE